LEGAGFAGAFLTGFTALASGFFGAAFLATVAFLTGFPEGFRVGEGLEDFFNGAKLVPKSRARKDPLSFAEGQGSLSG
jgi:hypothetical protein